MNACEQCCYFDPNPAKEETMSDVSFSDNWARPAQSFKAHGSAGTPEKVTCHKDGTVSYYSVTRIEKIRHTTEIVEGDRVFISPNSLSRADIHLKSRAH